MKHLLIFLVALVLSWPQIGFGQAAPALWSGSKEASDAIANSIARERPPNAAERERKRQEELADEKLMLKLFAQPLRQWDVPQPRQLIIGQDGGAISIEPEGPLRAKLVAVSPKYIWLEVPKGETHQIRKNRIPVKEQFIVWIQAMKALKRDAKTKWPKEAMARPKAY